MSPKPMRCLFAGAAIALAVLVSPALSAAGPSTAAHSAPVVVAQASVPAASPRAAAGMVDTTPSHLRGVRQAAAQGPEALRRYIWRTRMIYNFYYPDFAPRE